MLEISGESSGEEELGLPEDVLGEAAEAEELMVPTKSRPAYENVYSQFHSWMKEKKIASVSEKVILAYLHQKSKMGKPSSVWSYFSMLKSMLMFKEHIDISKFVYMYYN